MSCSTSRDVGAELTPDDVCCELVHLKPLTTTPDLEACEDVGQEQGIGELKVSQPSRAAPHGVLDEDVQVESVVVDRSLRHVRDYRRSSVLPVGAQALV